MVAWERERERERDVGWSRIDLWQLRYDIFRLIYIFRDPCYFVLFSRETDTGLPLNLEPSDPGLASKNGVTNHYLPLTLLTDFSLLRVENFCFIFFGSLRNSSNAVHETFLLSFVLFKTQPHILFQNKQTNRPVKGQYVRRRIYILRRNNQF